MVSRATAKEEREPKHAEKKMEGEGSFKTNAAECPVCMELYQSEGVHIPYVFACAHTLCHACSNGIKTTDSKTGAASWRCPTCQTVTTREPKPNFSLCDIIPSLLKMRLQPSQPAQPCENCDNAAATLWCQSCGAAMCQKCMDESHIVKIMQRHPRVLLAERAQLQGPSKCPTHGEVLKYLCMDCQELSCIDCMNFGEHKGHTHQLVTAVAEGQRNQLREGVVAAEAAEAAAAHVAGAVEAVVDEIGAVAGCCGGTGGSGTLGAERQRIVRAFGSLRAALDAREEELKAMVDALANEKAARANEQLHELGMHRSRLHAAKECAEATIAMAPGEVSARFKLCLDMLRAATATRVAGEPVVDARIPVNLPVDVLLSAIAGFGSAGGPRAPQNVQCALQGAMAVLTWEPPESSALPVVAYVVERAVGKGAQYQASGRTERARFEQRVDELAGQSVVYRVRAEDQGSNLGPWRQSGDTELPETFGTRHCFRSAFDLNGVLYHLGTAGGTRGYQNPHTAGAVVASMSSTCGAQGEPAFFVQNTHASPVYNFTNNIAESWMAVDLRTSRLVPDHYALRSDQLQCQQLRNWALQASNDNSTWTTLRQHSGDTSLGIGSMSVAAWPLEAGAVAGRSFRHFRILQTGPNSQNVDYLMCTGIELYGTLTGVSG